jgi:hypothetical protein
VKVPTYDVKMKEEVSWAAVAGAGGTLIGTILVAFNVDANIVAAAVAFSTVALRFVGGLLLPNGAS